jgi:hypothetical protein
MTTDGEITIAHLVTSKSDQIAAHLFTYGHCLIVNSSVNGAERPELTIKHPTSYEFKDIPVRPAIPDDPFSGPVISPDTPIGGRHSDAVLHAITGAEIELRAKALKAASMSCVRGMDPETVMSRARIYEEFLRGER